MKVRARLGRAAPSGAGLRRLGHEESQVPPEEAGGVRTRVVRRRRRHRQRGESHGPCVSWAARAAGAALPRAAGSFARKRAPPSSASSQLVPLRRPGDSSSLGPGLGVGAETLETLPVAATAQPPPLTPRSPKLLDETPALRDSIGPTPPSIPGFWLPSSLATPAPPLARGWPGSPRASCRAGPAGGRDGGTSAPRSGWAGQRPGCRPVALRALLGSETPRPRGRRVLAAVAVSLGKLDF